MVFFFKVFRFTYITFAFQKLYFPTNGDLSYKTELENFLGYVIFPLMPRYGSKPFIENTFQLLQMHNADLFTTYKHLA